jgi:hypothetical protein
VDSGGSPATCALSRSESMEASMKGSMDPSDAVDGEVTCTTPTEAVLASSESDSEV